MSPTEGKKPSFWIYILAAAVLAVVVVGALGYRQVTARLCEDLQARVLRALNANRHGEALRALGSPDNSCKEDAVIDGMRAEALARSNKADQALKAARAVRKTAPDEKHAAYAMAHAFWSKGDIDKTRKHAERAVKQGRGAPAHLLLGLVAIRRNDLPQAKSEFDAMLRIDPNDVMARFNLAFVDQEMDRYRHAREGYLAVLRLDPRHLDARYNLALLTHSAGAGREAQHHLAELIKIAPNDKRVTKLRRTFASTSRRRAAKVRPPARRTPVGGAPATAP
jgi:tetratricopeptide (TPR) repeat protein